MKEEIGLYEEGHRLRAKLPSEIDHHAARFLRERIDRKLFEVHPEVLVLDFSEVRFMDSSGIGLILGRAAIAEEQGACVQVVGVTERLERLLLLSGVDKMKNVTVRR